MYVFFMYICTRFHPLSSVFIRLSPTMYNNQNPNFYNTTHTTINSTIPMSESTNTNHQPETFDEEIITSSPPLHVQVAEGAPLLVPSPTKPIFLSSSRSSSRSRTSRHSSRSPSPHSNHSAPHTTPSSTPLSAASAIYHTRLGLMGSHSHGPQGRSTLGSFDGTNLLSSHEPSEDYFSAVSLDDDILTDKMGMLELEPPSPDHPSTHSSSSFLGGTTMGAGMSHPFLPSVNERMSEETLEDVHAFSDVIHFNMNPLNIMGSYNNNMNNASTTTSSTNSDKSVGGSSYVDQGHLLETLLEFEEEEDDEDENNDDENDENNDTNDPVKEKQKRDASSQNITSLEKNKNDEKQNNPKT